MKLSNVLVLAAGLGAGYVLGAAAGRERYDQITAGLTGLVRDPRVQEKVFDLADQVKANTDKMPGPVGGLVDNAASRVQESLTQPDETPEPTTTAG